jgi:hypothetical protein
LVSREDAEVFAQSWDFHKGGSSQHCCSKEDFRIDLYGPPHSPWNKSAAIVFGLDFMDVAHVQSSLEEVMDQFFTRLKSLKAKHKQAITLLSSAERLVKKQKERRAQRKQEVQ